MESEGRLRRYQNEIFLMKILRNLLARLYVKKMVTRQNAF